jgi:hypothetical protein
MILNLVPQNELDKLYDTKSNHNPISQIEYILIPLLESKFNKFTKDNEAVINTYLYWKDKIEEIKYRINPPFTLSIIKNRESNPSIVAKVKWIYKFKGDYKKTPYISVYIGSIEQYPKGLTDSKLFYDVPKKIQDYLNKTCPLELNPTP